MDIPGRSLQPLHIILVLHIEPGEFLHGFLRTELMMEMTGHGAVVGTEIAVVLLFHGITVGTVQIGIVRNLELQLPGITAPLLVGDGERQFLWLGGLCGLCHPAVHVLLDLPVKGLKLLFQLLQLLRLLPLLARDALQLGNLPRVGVTLKMLVPDDLGDAREGLVRVSCGKGLV